MAVAQPLGFEIDFVRNPLSGSAAWFFFFILKFIFTAIFEIKVHVKKFIHQIIIYFLKYIVYFSTNKILEKNSFGLTNSPKIYKFSFGPSPYLFETFQENITNFIKCTKIARLFTELRNFQEFLFPIPIPGIFPFTRFYKLALNENIPHPNPANSDCSRHLLSSFFLSKTWFLLKFF